jgi:hypothetical protein
VGVIDEEVLIGIFDFTWFCYEASCPKKWDVPMGSHTINRFGG